MSTAIEAARRAIEGANPAGALELLWQEKDDALAAGDAARVYEVIHLANTIFVQAGGEIRSRAGQLVESAGRDLEAMSSSAEVQQNAELLERLEAFERRLRGLEGELMELRALAAVPTKAVTAQEPEVIASPEAEPEVAPPVRRRRSTWDDIAALEAGVRRWAEGERRDQEEAAAGPPGPPPPAEPTEPLWERIGARALAWTGGAVTLLGIVLIFVLAANRGWLGPELRVVIGALVSVGLYGAGLYIHRRYGHVYAALGAAGAGIGGAYATLLAATALYDFVGEPIALLAAATIAGAGVATAVAWDAQMTAILGLVGAMLGPGAIQGGATTLGTAFVAILLAATVVLVNRTGWLETIVASGLASVPQIAVLLSTNDAGTDSRTAVLVAIFSLLYLASGLHLELRPVRPSDASAYAHVAAYLFVLGGIGLAVGISALVVPETPGAIAAIAGGLWLVLLALGSACQALLVRKPRLQRTPITLLLASFAVVFPAVLGWFVGERNEGFALLVVAAVYLVPLPLLRGRGLRDLSSLLWALSFTVAAVAVGEVFSGSERALVWAAQAALLAWLSARTREARLQFASVAYLVLALVQALGLDAPPRQLFVVGSHPAAGVASIVFVAVAAGVFGVFHRWRPGLVAAWAVAGALALYAGSLSLLELFQGVDPGSVEAAFQRAHVALGSSWAAIALVLLGLAVRRLWISFHWAGLALLAAALVKVLAFDLDRLSATNRSYSLLMVGALALLAGIVYAHGGDRLFPARLEPTQLHLVTVCCVLASVGFVVPAIVELLDGRTWVVEREPGGLLLAAAIYGAFSALVFREAEQRDLSTLLWTIGLVLAAVGSAMLLAGNWLTLAWTVVVVLLAWLASRTGEERLTLAAFAYLSIAALYTLAVAAPLSDLFVVDAHPAAGVPSVLLVGLALVGLALLAPPFSQRPLVYWVAGGTFLYASSLAILGFFQWFAEDEGRSVASAFDRGHTGVSALWGVMAFVLLVVGLSRRWRALRLAGLALFAATLAKIFLYDLSSLSSMARALSFLAVGMVLLLAAFVYQRVSERLEGVPRPFGEAR